MYEIAVSSGIYHHYSSVFLVFILQKICKKIPHLTLLHVSTGSFNHRRNKMHEISIFLNINSAYSTVSLNII
jgi:hypothetical protein